MTDRFAAARKRDAALLEDMAAYFTDAERDRRALLGEMDYASDLARSDERARIREALNELESAEPGEDAISREKALDLVMPS